MRKNHIKYLRCPKTLSELKLENPIFKDDEIESGLLVSGSGEKYSIIDFIPDFSFEKEHSTEISNLYDELWRQHDLPSYEDTLDDIKMKFQKSARLSESLETFFKGKTVLDMGCGMGRFSYMTAKLGAELLISVDYSRNALRLARQQTGNPENICFIRANVMSLPLKPIFDYTFSMGVLHHTPDTRVSFDKMVSLVKDGGYASIYVYKWGSLPRIQWYLRPYTLKMKEETVEKICDFGGWSYNRGKTGILPISKIFQTLGRFDRMGIGRITFEGLTTPFLWEHTCSEVVNWFVKNDFEILHATEEVAVTGRKKSSK